MPAQAGMLVSRAYTALSAQTMVQPVRQAMKKLTGPACWFIAISLASGIAPGAEPPPNLARLAAHRESETQAERNQYTYRESVLIQEWNDRGGVRGEYKEIRDVLFSPAMRREEVPVGQPRSSLQNLVLTPEDFEDIRNIQPFVLVEDFLPIYETKFRGEERMEEQDCWVLQVRPRQILAGQRLFDGMLWIRKADYSVVRSEGQAVPQIRTTKAENLFPRFTTIRRMVNGFWFPVYTNADDTLYFRNGAQRVKLAIKYDDYKKFGSDTTVTFEGTVDGKKEPPK